MGRDSKSCRRWKKRNRADGGKKERWAEKGKQTYLPELFGEKHSQVLVGTIDGETGGGGGGGEGWNRHGDGWIIARSMSKLYSPSQIHRDRSSLVTSRHPFRGLGQKRKDHPHTFFRAAVSCALSFFFYHAPRHKSTNFTEFYPTDTAHNPRIIGIPYQNLASNWLSPALGSPQPSLIGKTLQHPYIHPSAFFPAATHYPALAPPFHKVSPC